ADQLEAAAVWQPDIDHDHLRGQCLEPAERLRDAPRLAYDLEVRRALEGPAKPLADQLVVVNEQHRRGHEHLLSPRRRPRWRSPARPASAGSPSRPRRPYPRPLG